MRLGTSSKPAAMRVCDRLRPSTPRELTRMIADMGDESLAGYGIDPKLAADAARAARRMHASPLLRGCRRPEEVGGEPARVVGIGRGQWHASRMAPGGDVVIRRDTMTTCLIATRWPHMQAAGMWGASKGASHST